VGWTAAQILTWLDEVEPHADQRSHFEWLEMKPSASSVAIQNAYHAIARTRHPDLARRMMVPRDLDRLVRMYSRVTAAYAALRTSEAAAGYLRERRNTQQTATVAPPGTPGTHPPPIATPTPAAPPPPPFDPNAPIDPSREMNARALACYRRAEGALRTGDRSTALLQIRMAIAADPRSTLLRAALAEIMGA
jgi:hypothetical protein